VQVENKERKEFNNSTPTAEALSSRYQGKEISTGKQIKVKFSVPEKTHDDTFLKSRKEQGHRFQRKYSRVLTSPEDSYFMQSRWIQASQAHKKA
jgi:hypothetical protein